jgi:hypothetical protein
MALFEPLIEDSYIKDIKKLLPLSGILSKKERWYGGVVFSKPCTDFGV